jgi:hypothetical protein
MARSGALQARARELAGEHRSRAARSERLKVSGRQLGPSAPSATALSARHGPANSASAPLRRTFASAISRMPLASRIYSGSSGRATRPFEGTFVVLVSSRDAGALAHQRRRGGIVVYGQGRAAVHDDGGTTAPASLFSL